MAQIPEITFIVTEVTEDKIYLEPSEGSLSIRFLLFRPAPLEVASITISEMKLESIPE